MLKKEDNKLLTLTGPDTPMGQLLRRYWIPALLPEELPEPDCTPVRIRLLGEDLLAFRDTNNNISLIDEFCPHRGVSLYFGRNEECGLRCAYHGWKFDTHGDCVDMPSEPESSNFKDKIKLKAYPCKEKGGVIWAYMGPKDLMPELPELEWMNVPESHRYISKRIQENNYFQAVEGGIDSSHVSFLHRQGVSNLGESSEEVAKYFQQDTSPRFEVAAAPHGLLIGAGRKADENHTYWRITQFIMPWYTLVAPTGSETRGGHAWVPMDDETCWTWSMNYNWERPLTSNELNKYTSGLGIHAELIPGTFKTQLNKENDYLIDRELQKSGKSYTGIKGIGMEDVAVQESAKRIVDRAKEHLGTSDSGLIAARRCLLHAAKDLQKGIEPPNVHPSVHKVTSVAVILPNDVPFQEGASEKMKANV